MRANTFPTPAEVVEPLDKPRARLLLPEASKAVEWAVGEAERRMNKPIRLKVVDKTGIYLSNQPFLLEDFPVKKIRMKTGGLEVNGRSFETDEDNGIIYPHLPLLAYDISYQVGYEEGNLPTTVQYLIEELARHKLEPEFVTDHEEKVKMLVTVALRSWEYSERLRNGVRGQAR